MSRPINAIWPGSLITGRSSRFSIPTAAARSRIVWISRCSSARTCSGCSGKSTPNSPRRGAAARESLRNSAHDEQHVGLDRVQMRAVDQRRGVRERLLDAPAALRRRRPSSRAPPPGGDACRTAPRSDRATRSSPSSSIADAEAADRERVGRGVARLDADAPVEIREPAAARPRRRSARDPAFRWPTMSNSRGSRARPPASSRATRGRSRDAGAGRSVSGSVAYAACCTRS